MKRKSKLRPKQIIRILLLNGIHDDVSHQGVLFPSESNFYGEREPDDHGTPLERSLGPRSEPAAQGAGVIGTMLNLLKTLGEPGSLRVPAPLRLAAQVSHQLTALVLSAAELGTAELHRKQGGR